MVDAVAYDHHSVMGGLVNMAVAHAEKKRAALAPGNDHMCHWQRREFERRQRQAAKRSAA